MCRGGFRIPFGNCQRFGGFFPTNEGPSGGASAALHRDLIAAHGLGKRRIALKVRIVVRVANEPYPFVDKPDLPWSHDGYFTIPPDDEIVSTVADVCTVHVGPVRTRIIAKWEYQLFDGSVTVGTETQVAAQSGGVVAFRKWLPTDQA